MKPIPLALAALMLATAHAQSPAKPAPRAAVAKPGQATAVASLPAEAAAPLFVEFAGAAPHHNAQALLRQTRDRVRRAPTGGIEVDGDGDGRKWTPVPARGEASVAWWHAGRVGRLTFFEQAETWWVASTSTVEGVFGDAKVTCLDADADGICWEPTDYLRWGAGAFMPQGLAPSFDDGSRAGALRLVARSNQATFLLDESAPAADAASPATAARRALNALRNACGLPPCVPWPEGDAVLSMHVAYMHKHDPTGAKRLDPNFETTQLSGYDDAAANMAEQSLVLRQSGAPPAATTLLRGLARMRERAHLFGSAPGKFGFAENGEWRAARVVADAPSVVRYVALPAPGSANAPTTAEAPADAENPARGGVPISVRIDDSLVAAPHEFTVTEIALFAAATMQPVAGRLLSVREVDTSATIDHSWFFVPNEPLQAGAEYVVRARIASQARSGGSTNGAEVDRLRWQFRAAP